MNKKEATPIRRRLFFIHRMTQPTLTPDWEGTVRPES